MTMPSLLDASTFLDPSEAMDFVANVLEASTEYSIIGKDLTGKILLWNEGARRIYGYEATEVVGKLNSDILHDPADVEAGLPLEMRSVALTGGKWEGTVTRRRRDGNLFMARVVLTPRRNPQGEPIGFLLISKDISSEIRLTEELQATQFYTRTLIESNIDALMTTDAVGTITDVNQQMEWLTGRTREELIGSPFKEYFTDTDRAEDGIRQVLRESKVTNYELTARAKDGRETVVSYNATTFNDREGKLQGVFAAARDVTEQAALQSQLAEEQAYNRGLIEASIDGLVTVDETMTITDVNETLCRMVGRPRNQLIGTSFPGYFKETEQAADGVRLTFSKGQVTNYVLTLRAAGGREQPVSFNAAVFRDRAGEVRGIFASARNIADRVRLEDQMREQQTYLRGLIEASVDSLVTVDPDGYITDVNEQMCRTAGYERAELIGSVFGQYFTDPKAADAGVQETLSRGVVTNYELVLKHKSGRKATVSFNASVFRSAEGRLQGIFASARDISEQSRLQTQLTEHQAYNRSLIEASADALFAIAPDGVITDVNEEATRLSGYTRHHLISSGFAGYFTDPDRAGAGVAETFRSGRVLGYELTLVTRHGRKIAVSFNAGVFSDAAGQPLGILASARDSTSQKQLEQQLRDSQVYTRSLIESNIDALMTTDPVGIITDVNQQMEALTGRKRDELIGSAFKGYFTDQALAEDGIRLVLHEGKVENYELTARRRDGHETMVSYNASAFYDQEHTLQGVFAAARDVTERKRFEQTLQEKNLELENANTAKDRFLASMSHELRTPLNAILGFTGTMLMELPGPLNDEQRRQLGTVQSSGKHLLSIIDDLLDLAKIESGNLELELELVPVVCQEILNEVAGSLRPLIEGKGLEFSIDALDEQVTVRTDRRALTQILINLANNAIKFTDAGRITLTLSLAGDGRAVRLSVVDTGAGIAPEDQDRLFRAFEQVGEAKTRKFEGTGLGLYISRKLAELLGGEILMESVLGAGSTFTVALPVA